MRNTTYVIKISWCPDKLGAKDIEEALMDKFGVYAEVTEDENER